MMLCLLISFFLIYFFTCCLCKSDIPIGYRVMIPVPSVYNMNFTGRAFFLETTSSNGPNFKAALSVEAVNGKYSCSTQVFIGDFKVWSSGHFSQFYPSEICILELTENGDLQLKGSKQEIGWRTGTSGQGVERLRLLSTGNLVLTNWMNRATWRSFDSPTNVMLWGQSVSIATSLTSFPSNSNIFYSFEILYDKVALFLNSGTFRYSYWEFRPTKSRNITFAHLGSTGLKLFDRKYRKIAQISVGKRTGPLRFLALGDDTGNLGFYQYSSIKGKFEASFRAINTTCDLPLACGPYRICTHFNRCSCIQLSREVYGMDPKCNEGFSNGFCRGDDHVQMVELTGVSSVLRVPPRSVNLSKEECVSLCIDDCSCSAALYSATSSSGNQQECFHYGLVRGVKQVEQRIGLSYLVKVPKGLGESKRKSSKVKKWLLLMGGVIDGLIILLVMGGVGYYFFVIRKRRIDSLENESNTNA